MFRRLALLGALCCLSSPAFATEADFEKRMARGEIALEAGDFNRAKAEYREALKEHPTDMELALYFAVALSRSNDPEAEPVLKTLMRLDPNNPRVILELGIFYYNRKMFEESVDYLESLLAMRPDPETREAAQKYLDNIHGKSAGKRWGVTLSGGMQYDSNVSLAADPSLLPVGTDRMGDWKGIVNFGLNGVAYQDSRQELTGSYSLYQTLHFHLHDFNITQNAFDLSYKHRFSAICSAKLSTNFESTQLGDKPFVSGYSITPGLQLAFENEVNIGLDYRFHKSYFKNSDAYPTNTDRNGVIHSMIVNYNQQLSKTLILRGGYTFDRELAELSTWSSSTNTGTAGLTVSLPYALILDINGEAAARKYDENNPGDPEIRSDTTFSGGVAFIWQATERLSLSLDHKYSKNSSNIAGYSNTRGVSTIMLNGRY